MKNINMKHLRHRDPSSFAARALPASLTQRGFGLRVLLVLLVALSCYFDTIPRLQADQCLQPIPGLIRWYSGEGTAEDRLGGVGTGIWTNGQPSYVTGKVGQAFQFDGTKGVLTAGLPELDGGTAVTICAWVRPTKSGYGTIFYARGFGLELGNWVYSGSATFRISVKGGAYNYYSLDSKPLPADKWTFLAGAWDSSVAEMRMYVDGQLVGQPNPSNPPPGERLVPDFGQAYIGNSFLGDVDECLIFNRALQIDEIQAIYRSGSAGLCSLFFNIKPSDRNVEVGSTVIFNSTASAGPGKTVKYQWQFNGKDIDGATSASLTLSNLKNDQAGTYTVVATSSEGESISASAQLSFSFVSIHLYAGVTINGVVGSKWRIEYAEVSDATAWTALETITLSTTPQTYIDLSSGRVANRFYRAIQPD